jgi:dTDP-glucose 4,6-dehydratase
LRILVTGGGGFLGSHLCKRLVAEGNEVVCLDTFLTGSKENLQDLVDNPLFTLSSHDVTKHIEINGDLDWVMHLASPASPIDFAEYPIHILKLGALGTMNCLGLAKAKRANFFLASTSEVYGDPLEHPQTEEYWGNVNPIGPRGVYDEAKRFAEAMAFAYQRVHDIDIRVVRIFNTFGPFMRRGDGRAVPAFIDQALLGEPLTVHGDGKQTRSLCYVDDLIEGFVRMIRAPRVDGPVNLGNPVEVTVLEIAQAIVDLAGSSSEIVFTERPVDDPQQRCPDISKAKQILGWEPRVPMEEGLKKTIEWCSENWSR